MCQVEIGVPASELSQTQLIGNYNSVKTAAS